jgi:hypothetical protein
MLPDLYDPWVRELLGGEIPEETEATCHDCVMLAPPGEAAASTDRFFHPETKCCTYLPRLPNFLVGRVLADDDPALSAGRASVRARIAAGVAVTPLGLGQTPEFHALFSSESFGHEPTLRCPHYVESTGGCGIWRHRNAVCSTWFCKLVRGATGHRFWMALKDLLREVERTLSLWAALELGIGADELARLLAPAEEERVRRAPRGTFGRWQGREEELYEACAARVSTLTWQELAALCGPKVRAHVLIIFVLPIGSCLAASPPRRRARRIARPVPWHR